MLCQSDDDDEGGLGDIVFDRAFDTLWSVLVGGGSSGSSGGATALGPGSGGDSGTKSLPRSSK